MTPRRRRRTSACSRSPSAWDVTTGSDDVVVAVLDSGVDATHPDLAGRLVAGTNIANHDNDPADDRGHGTRMAGIIAAATNNRLGMAGVAWAGKIMPVKVAGPSGAAADRDVAAGIKWATDHGAKVLSLSLGAPGDDVVLQQAVDYATAHDVLVVAAAGNGGSSVPEYPAACRGVLAVGATDTSGRRAPF
ncbi:MAG TPA: S8 family serine peptidase, partial [Acidimicrobiia bacterium]|nr:S8 family serine peptidase [Acidimicrobiia bacterium]